MALHVSTLKRHSPNLEVALFSRNFISHIPFDPYSTLSLDYGVGHFVSVGTLAWTCWNIWNTRSVESCLMFRARTIGIMYKYGLHFTDTLLFCANPLGSVVVWQTEVLHDSAMLFIIFYRTHPKSSKILAGEGHCWCMAIMNPVKVIFWYITKETMCPSQLCKSELLNSCHFFIINAAPAKFFIMKLESVVIPSYMWDNI